MKTKRAEAVLFSTAYGCQLQFRVVRDIQQWEGRTVGICRNSLGAEYVVQKNTVADRWDVLTGVSVDDLRAEVGL